MRGLLERAHFYRALGQTRYNAEALADLARAAVEAKRGQMDLLYADVLLQQVACYLDDWAVMTTSERSSNRDKITDSLNLAAELGHHHRLRKAPGDAGQPAGSRG